MRSGVFRWLVFASVLGFAHEGLAQAAPVDPETLRQAADEFEAGRRAFKARDYEGAAVHFENADRLAPNADTLRIAIRARKEARQSDRAATLAALALARHPKEKALRSFAESVISASEKQLHKVEVRCEPSCSLAVNNRVTPYEQVDSAVIYVEPGDHAIVAGWSGNRTETSEIHATAGSTSSIELAAPPEAEPVTSAAAEEEAPAASETGAAVDIASDAPTSRAGLPPAVFWAGAGLTAVLGGVTVWSGLDTQTNPGPDKVKADCAGRGESCPTYQDGLARQRRTNILLAATGAVGVATAIVGIFATDWQAADAEPTATGRKLVPVVGLGDGITVGAVGRF